MMWKILDDIVKNGGKPYYVGGYVRDTLLGIPNCDVDVEVFHLPAPHLFEILSRHGEVSVVGESFGVIKLRCPQGNFDFSLPRKERKTGTSHRDFDVSADINMTPREAASRRDFTINSIMMSSTGEILDPFGGVQDLRNKILRHTSPAFSEDPLRVLRGFQFCARFGLTAAPKTVSLCKTLFNEFPTIASERITGEFIKWGTSNKPSKGLEFLVQTGWIERFPELYELVNCIHDYEKHPEGWSYSIISPSSFVTSVTKSIRSNLTLRQFIQQSTTNNTTLKASRATPATHSVIYTSTDSFPSTLATRTFRFKFAGSFLITTFTQPKSFMLPIETPTIKTTKIIRIMFQISRSSMLSVVNSSINDFEIVQRIISSVSIYMMNVFSGFQLPTNFQLHQIPMEPLNLPAGNIDFNISQIPATIVNLMFNIIDDSIIVAIDIAVDKKINHIMSPDLKKYVSSHNTIHQIPIIQINIGTVFDHTKYVCDEAACLANAHSLSKEDTAIGVLAALLHDVGKPSTTKIHDGGKITSYNHDVIGERIARQFLLNLKGLPYSWIDKICELVKLHMVHLHCSEPPSAKFVRKFLHRKMRYSSVEALERLMTADSFGRPPTPRILSDRATSFLDALKAELARGPVEPHVKGRDLIALGVEPGPKMGRKLEELYNLQISKGLSKEELLCRISSK